MKEEKTIHFIADLTIQDCKNLQKIMGIKYSNKLKLLFTLSLILIALNIIGAYRSGYYNEMGFLDIMYENITVPLFLSWVIGAYLSKNLMVKNYYRAFKDSIYDIDTDKITIEKKGIEVNYKYSAIKNYIDEKNFYLLSFEFCKLVVPKKFLSSKENEFLKGILEKYKIPPVTMMKDKQNNQNKYFKGLYLFYTIFYYIGIVLLVFGIFLELLDILFRE